MTGLLAGRRILVVEDEMLVLMNIETMLEDLGCAAISAAASVAEALALIEADTFDAAVLDVNLAGERSDAVAQALATRGIPFAFSTGYGEHADFAQRPVLGKPYFAHDFAAVMAALVTAGSLDAAA